MAVKQEKSEISVIEVTRGSIDFHIVGTMPLICNRMSEKAKRELLMPKGRKNAAEKASTLKHHPIDEYRASPYTLEDDSAPTLLAGLSTWFKQAMGTAALDLPGVQRTQILRLMWVEGERVPLYGTPKLFMAITRSADIKKTPDVRTRAIVPKWACQITVSYVRPLLREQVVANLLAAAGVTAGVGDWRQEKGSGSYGQFRICPPNDAEYQAILKQGRAAQVKAMKDAEPYDAESAELLGWFHAEVGKRGFSSTKAEPSEPAAVAPAGRRRSRTNGEVRA